MKTNVGTIDRIFRVALAAIIAVLFFTKVIPGVLGIALLSLAGIFLVTSLASFCPLYAIFGVRTCPNPK